MPIKNDWLVPNAVIFSHYSGATTEDELIDSTKSVNAMIDSSDSPFVHIIVDSTAVTTSPPLPVTIKVAKSSPSHERAGWLLTVGGQNTVVKFAMSVARQLLKARTQNFETLPEAVAFLKSMDETIDWSQARTVSR